MELIANKVYLTFKDAVECGLSTEGSLWTANSKGTKGWGFMKDPNDGRKVLIEFDALNDERRRKVELRFGNVYDRMARKPILDMVVNDWKANEYYKQYRYLTATIADSSNGTEKYLPINRVSQYTRAASWLNMIGEATSNKGIIKKQLKLTVPDFFTHVAGLMNVEKGRAKIEEYAGIDVLPGDFPTSYQRLMAKVEKYKAEGYNHLIDPLYGNKNAAKIGRSASPIPSPSAIAQGELREVGGPGSLGITEGIGTEIALISEEIYPKSVHKGGAFDPKQAEDQKAIIRAISRKHNNFDAGQVAEMANLLFTLNGWKTLSRARVHDIMSENKHLTISGSRGKREYMDKISMQNKRKAPPFPMVYWTLDGWTVELLYRERTKDKKGNAKTDYNRLVLVVVLDPVNKYPIGYAIGERENTGLIKMACKNALLHTYELFGQMYHPLQLQSDRYQVKHMTPFYQAVSILYTPAEAKNAKAKVIEPYFRYLNKKRCQKYANWSGFNLDSRKDNQVNREWLDQVKDTLPGKAEVIRQIEMIMSRERADKIGVYMEKWAQFPEADRRPMNEMGYLEAVGQQLGDRPSSITGQGIEKQIDNVEYTFDSFEPKFRANRHIKWELYGDMDNLSKVLAKSPDGKLKFVLDGKRILPMDIYSTTQEDVDSRMRVKHFNKDRVKEITELSSKDSDTIREVIENTSFLLNEEEETDLKLMFVVDGQQKERIQDAKRLGKAQRMLEQQKAKEVATEAQDWDAQRLAWLQGQ